MNKKEELKSQGSSGFNLKLNVDKNISSLRSNYVPDFGFNEQFVFTEERANVWKFFADFVSPYPKYARLQNYI
jgi:hypothetical protein